MENRPTPSFPPCVGVREFTPEAIEGLRAASAAAAPSLAGPLSKTKVCLLFLGCPRSGHSLVGALVDAHPHAMIAHELDLLAFVEAGFTWPQIASLVHENVRQFAEAGRKWEGYSYEVPGSGQGAADPLLVVGDKKGVRTTRRLAAEPGLLARLEALVPVPVRFVHVIRNPFDIVATRHTRSGRDLDTLIERTEGVLRAVDRITAAVGAARVHTVRHEDVIARPKESLEGVARFAGLTPDPAWLAAAAAVVFPRPRRTREGVEWTPAQIARVRSMMAQFPAFRGYDLER